MNKVRFMPKAIQVICEKIFSEIGKTKSQKTPFSEYKQTKDSYLLTFSAHHENKPFEVGAEPRRPRARG